LNAHDAVLWAPPAQYLEQGLRNGTVSVRPFVAFLYHPAAAGLLLWAQSAGDIDRLLPGTQQRGLQ